MFNLSFDVISRFVSYLEGRSQCVEVLGVYSSWISASSEVPRDQYLVLFCFLSHYNHDICMNLRFCRLHFFTDDCQMCFSFCSCDDEVGEILINGALLKNTIKLMITNSISCYKTLQLSSFVW
jgi:hypothetical protein